MIVFNRPLTEQERTELFDYLSGKYLTGKPGGLRPDAPAIKYALSAWFTADRLSETLADGQPVTQWPAEIGGTMDVPNEELPNGKSAAAPTLVKDAANGHAAVRFDGVDDLLRVTARPGGIDPTRAVSVAGDGELNAFVRAKPGDKQAPVVIHLVDWCEDAPAGTVFLRAADFFGGEPLKVQLLVPPPYDKAVHGRAFETKDYSTLAVPAAVKVSTEGDLTRVDLPPLKPWGILVVEKGGM